MREEEIVEIGAEAAFKNSHPAGRWDLCAPFVREQRLSDFRASLAALRAHGMEVVPVEANETMKVNGGLAFENAAFGEGKLVFDAAGDAYGMMIKAWREMNG